MRVCHQGPAAGDTSHTQRSMRPARGLQCLPEAPMLLKGMPSSSCKPWQSCSAQHGQNKSQQRSACRCACSQEALAVVGNLPLNGGAAMQYLPSASFAEPQQLRSNRAEQLSEWHAMYTPQCAPASHRPGLRGKSRSRLPLHQHRTVPSVANLESPLDETHAAATPHNICKQAVAVLRSCLSQSELSHCAYDQEPQAPVQHPEGVCSGSAKGACAPAAPELHSASLLTGCEEDVLTRERASPE